MSIKNKEILPSTIVETNIDEKLNFQVVSYENDYIENPYLHAIVLRHYMTKDNIHVEAAYQKYLLNLTQEKLDIMVSEIADYTQGKSIVTGNWQKYCLKITLPKNKESSVASAFKSAIEKKNMK